MKKTLRLLPIFLPALTGFLVSAAVASLPLRTAGLRAALSDANAVRDVYYVRGMNCRACTLIIDRNLNDMEGIYWARFSYPVRLLTVYRDPAKMEGETVEDLLRSSGKLELVPLARGKAAGLAGAAEGAPAVSWEGGELSVSEAREAPLRFMSMLEAYMIEPGTNEWHQVNYEVAAEEARTRIFLDRAQKSGYLPGAPGGELPVFISKEFYWPSELMPLTPEEGAIGRFVRERVTGGDESEAGMQKFDDWLLGLWKEVRLDYRAEMLELAE